MTTSPSPSDPAAVTLELERIRRTIEVGHARIDGALALLVQRHDQTEQHLAEQGIRLDDHAARLDALERGETERQRRTEQRLDALESARWPLPSLAALTAVCGLALSVWQLAAR
ncbi:hypothetical protein [Streptomyces catenulae]|uniref:DUF3618 domain-containing protein n=1 Tax=Streptomyces catenulae TaxID=66875 RepID=A0ABV2Z4H9_9ACTN|nr:hypothetical protein [Streptomyces catenulae]